jgi:hypothetical protein
MKGNRPNLFGYCNGILLEQLRRTMKTPRKTLVRIVGVYYMDILGFRHPVNDFVGL